MLVIPAMASAENQTSIIGPNNLPTAAVPNRCTPNKIRIMTTVSGITILFKSGCTTSKPSTAERTEIAGVITDSPSNIQAPSAPNMSNTLNRLRLVLAERNAIAIKDNTPPSPWLSARKTKVTYFNVTTNVSDQNIREIMPKTACSENGMPCTGEKHSLSA